MSRQRDYQKRMRDQGRCKQCGKPCEPSTRKGQLFKTLCQSCNVKANENQRRKNGATRRNLKAAVYNVK